MDTDTKLRVALIDVKHTHETIRKLLVEVGQYVADPINANPDSEAYLETLEGLFRGVSIIDSLQSAMKSLEELTATEGQQEGGR